MIAKSRLNYTDEQIYQNARRILIGEYQHILFEEWLPTLLGPTLAGSIFPPGTNSTNYNPNLNPSIFNEVSTAAHRYGHTFLNGFSILMIHLMAIFLSSTCFDLSSTIQLAMLQIQTMECALSWKDWLCKVHSPLITSSLLTSLASIWRDLITATSRRRSDGQKHSAID